MNMERFKKIALRLLRPKLIWLVLFVIAAAAALIYVFTSEWLDTPAAYVVYVFSAYALSALAFSIPKLVNKSRSLIFSNEHSSRYVTDTPFRTMILMHGSLMINLFFAVFKLITAIIYSSFWFGAVAIYYIILCVARAFLLRHLRSGDYNQKQKMLAFRNCGVFIFIINIALTGVAYQMVFDGMSYAYPGLMIYAVAAYAFYCITMAIINTVKHRKLENPLVSASKAINLVTALVSIFALQTAMFAEFGADIDGQIQLVMNVATSAAVCLIIFITGVLMVRRGDKMLKTLDVQSQMLSD